MNTTVPWAPALLLAAIVALALAVEIIGAVLRAPRRPRTSYWKAPGR